jgi:hypothetical protein
VSHALVATVWLGVAQRWRHSAMRPQLHRRGAGQHGAPAWRNEDGEGGTRALLNHDRALVAWHGVMVAALGDGSSIYGSSDVDERMTGDPHQWQNDGGTGQFVLDRQRQFFIDGKDLLDHRRAERWWLDPTLGVRLPACGRRNKVRTGGEDGAEKNFGGAPQR